MIVALGRNGRGQHIDGLEDAAIPQIRQLIASGTLRKRSREELKHDEPLLTRMLEKLGRAA